MGGRVGRELPWRAGDPPKRSWSQSHMYCRTLEETLAEAPKNPLRGKFPRRASISAAIYRGAKFREKLKDNN